MTEETGADQLRRRNQELAILNTIAEALNREVDLHRALHAVLGQVAELLDLRTGWIWLLREGTDNFYLAAAQNLPPALADNPACMEGSCYCLDTFQAGDMAGAANINVVTCSRLKGRLEGTGGLRFHASIPLYAHSSKLGVLNLASPSWKRLPPDTLRLLHTMGDLLAIAVERARLFARSTQLGVVEERNRLAREIHDTIAQGLTATILQLEIADALLEAEATAPPARQAVRKALELTRHNMEEARRSVVDLRAAPLEGRTLAEAIMSILDEQARAAAVETRFEVTGEYLPLPVRVEAGLFRIAQEAVTNVVRHAQASIIKIDLLSTPDQAQLTVEDDGQGFDPAVLVEGRFGLMGLNERARLLGGTLQVYSAPGEGTKLQVIIPLGAG
jgi:two-component system, NarL family, sensor kinase